ncbi:MAG: hypothetical protein ACX932_06515 [Gammaproteobacteria bacterium]
MKNFKYFLCVTVLLYWGIVGYTQPAREASQNSDYSSVVSEIYQQLLSYFTVWANDVSIPQLKKLDLMLLNPAQPDNWQQTIYSNLDEGLSQVWPALDANTATGEALKVVFFLGDTNASMNLHGQQFPISNSATYLDNFANLIPMSYPSNGDATALKPFNIGTIVNTNALTAADNKDAAAFLQFISGNAIPLNIYPTRLLPTDASQRNVTMKKYLATLGTYQAMESVGLNNMSRLLAERQIQPGLGEKAGLVNFNAQGEKEELSDASPLQVEKFTAERRVVDPDWYAQMQKTTTPGLMREMLYIEAERRRMDMLILEELKRITTTLSAIELQTQMGITRTLLTASSLQVSASERR